MKKLKIKTRNLMLACLFIAPILFTNCDKDDDEISCDSDVFERKVEKEYEYFLDITVDFQHNPTASNCRKFKTSVGNLIKLAKETQECPNYEYDIDDEVLSDLTINHNKIDCSDF